MAIEFGETVAAWAVAFVFASAAIGKLLSFRGIRGLPLIAYESMLGVIVLAPPLALPGAALAAGTSVVYAVYAFTRRSQERCHCFGEKLPSSGRDSQQFRNLALALLAIALLWMTLAYRPASALSGPPSRAAVYVATGVLLGFSLVAGPWVFEWSAGKEESET